MSSTQSDAPLTSENIEEFIREMMTALVHTTRSAQSLPTDSDFDYYETFEEFRSGVRSLSGTVAGMIHRLCGVVQKDTGNGATPPLDLTDATLYDMIVEMIDTLLESADLKMDQIETGGEGVSNKIKESLRVDQDRLLAVQCKDMVKPQLKFLEEIDNSRRRPFRPRLRSKPHSVVPLDINELPLQRDVEEDLTIVRPNSFFPHPYHQEILNVCQRFQYQSLIDDASFVNPQHPSPSQPFELVETVEALQRMVDELDVAKEIAVDLEHHHWRSFLGLTCLMQVSSREKDYIVDVLALRQNMSLLLPIFTDPDVVKVFHGCDKDILWLQRDLGLYVVNCFDTYHAAKILRYPALSLAHILKYHCNVTLNKKYQLADWRERPLPAHLIEYAKLDTHYLLYVYDCLRRDVNASHGRSGVEMVYEASRQTCLQRYEKDGFDPLGYLKIVAASSKNKKCENDLTFEQNATLSCLWNWRDLTARRMDESVGYIMSNAELLRIGMAAPTTSQGILATGPLSEFVRAHLEEVTGVIQEQVHGSGGATTDNLESDKMQIDDSFLSDDFSPSKASKKRSSFEVGMGGSRHQVGRLQGYSTVTEFVPCIPALPKTSSFRAAENKSDNHNVSALHLRVKQSVEADPKWQEKLFKEANWCPRRNPSSKIKVESPVDTAFVAKSGALSESDAMKSKVDKSERELKQFSVFGESKGDIFSASGDKVENDKKKNATDAGAAEQSALSSDGVELLDTLPKSLVDIYSISNRNKHKNKEKKRNKEAEPSSSSHSSQLKPTADDWYHVTDKKPVEGVDSTIDFASKLGWVESDTRAQEDLKRKHASGEAGNVTGSFEYSSMGAGMGAMQGLSKSNESAAGGYNPFLSSGGSSSQRYSSSMSKTKKQVSNSGKTKQNTVVERRDTNRSQIFSSSKR